MACNRATGTCSGAMHGGRFKPRPCPGPSPPRWEPGPPRTCDRRRCSRPASSPRAPPPRKGWCSWRSRWESRLLRGWPGQTTLLRSPTSRSWRRARRSPRGSSGRSPGWRRLSCSGRCSFDFSGGPAAFSPCSSWSPSSPPPSRSEPCSLSGSRPRPSCICESRFRTRHFISLCLLVPSGLLWAQPSNCCVGHEPRQTWSGNGPTAISARVSCGDEAWGCNTKRRPYHRYGTYI